MTKEEIMQAIQECAAELGRPPSLRELKTKQGVLDGHIRKHFLTYQRALAECGMARGGSGYKIAEEALFRDWAEVTRKLGKVPNVAEYDMYSRYSHRPLVSRFASWRQARMGLLRLAEENGWEAEWKDAVDMLREHLRDTTASGRTSKRRCSGHGSASCSASPWSGILKDRPTYGPPVGAAPLAHGPMNEAGVLFLFGMLAARLGFVVTRIQTEFPDCEAMREVAPGVWQRVRIELEYESRNFVKHLHDPGECDLIVCWVDNWPECPLEVVELRGKIAEIATGSPSSREIG